MPNNAHSWLAHKYTTSRQDPGALKLDRGMLLALSRVLACSVTWIIKISKYASIKPGTCSSLFIIPEKQYFGFINQGRAEGGTTRPKALKLLGRKILYPSNN
jgi:hypothetical protein